MYVIKRTKGPPPGPMDALVGRAPPAVHWAVLVAAEGNVTAWTPDRDKAGEFSREVAEKTLAHYARRPLAGRLEMAPVLPPVPPGQEAVSGTPAPAPAPAPEPVPVPEAEPEADIDAPDVPAPEVPELHPKSQKKHGRR